MREGKRRNAGERSERKREKREIKEGEMRKRDRGENLKRGKRREGKGWKVERGRRAMKRNGGGERMNTNATPDYTCARFAGSRCPEEILV